MCLENCLMIGIMMPVGVSCLSTLSPHERGEKSELADAETSSTSSPGCSLVRPPCHSKTSNPPHVNQNYTTSTGLSPGGRSSPCLPCRTAFSCPGIMSAGDIQAWCDVAFTKGHVRHLRSVCISRTGSRHMGAGIGHYPGPQGGSLLWGFVSGILISLFQWRAPNAGPCLDAEQRTTGFNCQSQKSTRRIGDILFCFRTNCISWCSW